MEILLASAFSLFAGLMMTRAFKYLGLRLPDVTAFLLAGVLVGPCCLGRLGIPGIGFSSPAEIDRVGFLSTVALGFIAFDIGNEFRLEQLRKTGRSAAVIGVIQSVGAAVTVDIFLIMLSLFLGRDRLPVPAAITLGAIASATAPAATLMVVRQYKAKGPLTDLLLPIVALDDAVGLVIFAVSFGAAGAMAGGDISPVTVALQPLVEIISSVILGSVMGIILTWLEKIFFSNSNRLSLTISFVIMTIALSSVSVPVTEHLSVAFSPLLVSMMLGTVFCNMSEFSDDLMTRSSRWTAPLYAVFFVLSGAQLDLTVLREGSVLLIGAVYIISRCIGKYYGARLSCEMMHEDKKVRDYLGITLFPQAGVALGMVVTAQSLGNEMGGLIRNIILFSVLVYELIGPALTRLSLEKAGEIVPGRGDDKNRERFRTKKAAS